MAKAGRSISEKIDDLKSEIDWFYGDEFVLEEAMERYRKALVLSKTIEEDLDKMKNEIVVIDRDFSQGDSLEK